MVTCGTDAEAEQMLMGIWGQDPGSELDSSLNVEDVLPLMLTLLSGCGLGEFTPALQTYLGPKGGCAPEAIPCDWCGALSACRCEQALLNKLKTLEEKEAVGKLDSRAADAASSLDGNTSSPPNLQGQWLLSRIEGDFEELMIDQGFSWSYRAMVRGVNYGIGMVTHNIRQNGNAVSVCYENGPTARHSMSIHVGAGEQATVSEDGRPIVVAPMWEGSSLCLAGRDRNGVAEQPSRRFLVGRELVCESTTSHGAVARRVFVRT